MKRFFKAIICIMMLTAMLMPSVALASTTPVLKSISFYDCKLDTKFSSDIYEYNITLTKAEATPILKDFEIDGQGDLYITYATNEANQPTGIVATLEYATGSAIYTFNYKNDKEFKKNSNCNLKLLDVELGEVYPAIDDTRTQYDLYIPSDMTDLHITAVAENAHAYCEYMQSYTLRADQEAKILVTVIASDATTQKEYTFNIKRLDMNTKELNERLKSEDLTSIIESQFLHQKPEFAIIIGSIIGGIILIIILIKVSKRLTVKIEDLDEKEFFDEIELEDTDEEIND